MMEFEQPKCVNCLKQYTFKGMSVYVCFCGTEKLVWLRRRFASLESLASRDQLLRLQAKGWRGEGELGRKEGGGV